MYYIPGANISIVSVWYIRLQILKSPELEFYQNLLGSLSYGSYELVNYWMNNNNNNNIYFIILRHYMNNLFRNKLST